MSSPDPDDAPVAVPPAGGGPAWFPPAPAAVAQPPARRPWSAFREVRGDLRTAAVIVGVLAVAGFLIGLLWWLLAPRADFRITANGPAVVGNPSEEIFAAADSIFALLMAGLGLLAGVLAWSLLRRRRGIAVLLGLAVGTAAAGVIAWRLGELLGPAPTKAELTDVGGRVTTALSLHSLPGLPARRWRGGRSARSSSPWPSGCSPAATTWAARTCPRPRSPPSRRSTS